MHKFRKQIFHQEIELYIKTKTDDCAPILIVYITLFMMTLGIFLLYFPFFSFTFILLYPCNFAVECSFLIKQYRFDL